jgi:hypothetical protein
MICYLCELTPEACSYLRSGALVKEKTVYLSNKPIIVVSYNI